MSRKYFGTDGIRGRVGEHPITADFILKLGWAAGKVLTNMPMVKKIGLLLVKTQESLGICLSLHWRQGLLLQV